MPASGQYSGQQPPYPQQRGDFPALPAQRQCSPPRHLYDPPAPFAPQPAGTGQRRPRRRTATVVATVALGVVATGGAVAIASVAWGGDLFQRDKPPLARTAGLNQAARDGRFEFKVTSVECGKTEVGNTYISKKSRGQFCVVSLSVRNTGGKAKMFVVDNQKAYSAEGVEYSPDPTATMYSSSEQSMWFSTISPGRTVTGPLVYDVPAEVELAKLRLRDSMRSDGVTITVPPSQPRATGDDHR